MPHWSELILTYPFLGWALKVRLAFQRHQCGSYTSYKREKRLEKECLHQIFLTRTIRVSIGIALSIEKKAGRSVRENDLGKWLLITFHERASKVTQLFSFCPFQGAIATTMTQPLDVLKTRAMNSKPGEFKGALDLVTFTAKQGPLAFYKGYIPAFVRLGPHTVLTFIFFEQLRMNFGKIPEVK